MRRRILIFMLLLSLCIAPSAFSNLKPADFQYSAELEGNIKKNTLYQVALSSDILSRCSSECSDLRLLGPDNLEVPYTVIKNDKLMTGDEALYFPVIRYEQLKTMSMLTVKSPAADKPFSMIKLDISDRDFERRIVLRGSNDMNTWILLAEDSIYDYSSQVDLRKTDIKFSPSAFLYYRIEMKTSQSSEEAGEKIRLQYKDLLFSVNNANKNKLRINRIQGLTYSGQNADAVYDEVEFTKFNRYMEKESETVVVLKADLPFSEVSFNVSNPYYYRTVEIYGSVSGEEKSYTFIRCDSIYRFILSGDKETKNHIAFESDKFRYYKFVIRNADNPRLKLDGIKFRWLRRSLYFVALHDNQKYILAFGGPSYKKPDYELSKFINPGNRYLQSYEILPTPGVRVNPNYKPLWSVNMKEIFEKKVLTVIVVILVIGISYWLFNLVRKSSNHHV